ncbi:MAG: peptide chain release factor 1 [Acidimicrobiaceae bacterium]|nr:peptide chain release factor 1 [Acidimicrobiaceae bacterium]
MLTDGLSDYEREYDDVLRELADPKVFSDQRRAKELSRRRKELEAIIAAIKRYSAALDDLDTIRQMHQEASPIEREQLKSDISELEAEAEASKDDLELILLPSDPNDGRNVIVEIRGAEGGEEANLFAKDLFEMYIRFAEKVGWKTEVLSSDPSDMGGLNGVTFVVKGDDAWRKLKHEGGPHRVQRVPVTEARGRIHTSSSTVTVLPEADEIEVDIDPQDLRIDVYRATGPGGQSVNTTDSAVRITHIPTGIVVSMQDEKSQIQNRARALQVLRARLLKAEQDRQSAELSEARRSQVGGGGRSEKIRTYNFPENRVTDHRIGLTLRKLDRVLQGDIGEIVDALLANERAEQLSIYRGSN